MLDWFVNLDTDTYNSLIFTSLGFSIQIFEHSYLYFFSAWFNINKSIKTFITTIHTNPGLADAKVAKNHTQN